MASSLSSQLLIETNDLSQWDDDRLLRVFVGSPAVFAQHHIPGSALISPADLVSGQPPATGKLPGEQQLSQLFSSIGLNDDRIVIAYDDEGGGWAGRLIWTLDILGHRHSHLLNGGLIAWLGENRAIETGSTTIAPPTIANSHYTATIEPSDALTQRVTVDDILSQLNDDNFCIWDARSAQEHSGESAFAQRGGRIPGAKNVDWLELMDRNNYLRLKPLKEIQALLDDRGISADKSIVTHCQSHHRSGLSYVVGKALGLSIRAYDGSWSEWGNLSDTPIESDV